MESSRPRSSCAPAALAIGVVLAARALLGCSGEPRDASPAGEVEAAAAAPERSGASPEAKAEAIAALHAGRALFLKNEPLAAAEELRRAVRLDPDNAEAHLTLGKALLDLSSVLFGTPTWNQETLTEVVGVLQRANELEPQNAAPEAIQRHRVAAAFWLGYALLLKERTPEAIAEFERTVQLDPHHGHAWKQLGLVHEKEGDVERAMKALLEAQRALPEDDEVLFHIGMLREGDDDLEGAREAYAGATRLNPANPGPYSRLAAVCERLGDEEGAARASQDFAAWSGYGKRLKEATQRVEVAKDDSLAMVELAKVYAEAQMKVPALTWFRRAQNADPAGANARIDAALREVESQLEPANVAGRLTLAELLLELGLADEARARCRAILEIDPGNDAARAALERTEGNG